MRVWKVGLHGLFAATIVPYLCPAVALSSTAGTSQCAVVGCGVLGTSLCKQIIASPECQSMEVTGITKTFNRHEAIQNQVGPNERFHTKTADECKGKKFRDVVFCAPPSGFEDYPAAVEDAITNLWAGPSEGGVFVFTSSGGIYGGGDKKLVTVTESSPTADVAKNPRVGRLVEAEKACTKHGGCCLRLAGLYLLERGAHSFWLNSGKDISGREDGVINLLHYDDAASACLAAIQSGSEVVSGKTFLISDGNPMTRREIIEAALRSDMYKGKPIPKFVGSEDDAIGKVYDGSMSNTVLQWAPKYKSFDEFISTTST